MNGHMAEISAEGSFGFGVDDRGTLALEKQVAVIIATTVSPRNRQNSITNVTIHSYLKIIWATM